jgi:hypothetical protein
VKLTADYTPSGPHENCGAIQARLRQILCASTSGKNYGQSRQSQHNRNTIFAAGRLQQWQWQ